MPVMTTKDDGPRQLMGMPNSIEPQAKTKAERTPATTAINDAILVVAGCWILLVLLSYSLRHHNV
jgi:hypothetical protein